MASVRRNTAWNLVGAGLPILIGVPAVPFLVRQVGVEAFGVFTLIWALIGYFSVFDLGLGRALTHQVSTKVARADLDALPGLVRSGLWLTLAAGAVGASLLLLTANPLGRSWLNVSEGLTPETIVSLKLAALGIPLTTVTSGLRGVLEGFEDFRVTNVLRTILGTVSFGFPVLATIYIGPSLPVLVVSLLLARSLVLLGHLAAASRRVSLTATAKAVPRKEAFALLNFGAWMTVSNVASPLMVTADRFVISAMLGAGAVAYYTIPFDFIVRLLVIPAALTSVLFPRFTLLLGRSGSDAAPLYRRSVLAVAAVMLPVCGLIIVGSRWGLALWLGDDFAEQAWLLSSVLGLGLLFNSLAQIPHALVQAAGNVRVTALLHLVEFILYFPLLLFALESWGVVGAAWAWTIRVTVDYVALRGISLRYRRPSPDAKQTL